ncbi:MAG: GAF domain-containing protein, partial [Candidatus Marsarchaeota archaeon]|nr:GAF domain-containing protein [Candidatus Marsarchaeota archaeon]
ALLQHELWVDNLVTKWSVTAICLYDPLAICGEMIVQALRTHEAMILADGTVLDSASISTKDLFRRFGVTAPHNDLAKSEKEGYRPDIESLTTDLQVINAFGAILGSISSELEIAKVVSDAARVFFEADLSALVLTHDTADASTVVFSHRDQKRIRCRTVRLSRQKKSEDPMPVNQLPSNLSDLLMTMGVNADHMGYSVGVPLLVAGQSLGTLFLGYQRNTPIHPWLLALLKTLAYQVTLVLQLTRTGARQAEGQKRAEALYEVTHALTTTLELHQVLHLVVEKACRLLNVDRCTMFLLHESKEYLYGVVSSTMSDERARRLRKPLDKDMATRQAVESKKPALIVDAPNDPRPLHDAVLRYGITNALYVPLVAHDEVIGTIDIDDTRYVHSFTKEEQDLMMAFANEAAVAIENAMLYERERQAVAKLQELNTLINDQHAKLQHSVSIHDQLTKMVLQGHGMTAIAGTLASLVRHAVIVEDQFHHLVASSQNPDITDKYRQEAITLSGTPKEIFADEEVAKLLECAREEKRPIRIPRFPQYGRDNSCVVAPIMVGDSVLGYVSIVESETPLEDLDLVALEHAASVFALEMMKQKSAFEVEMRLKGDFIEDLITGNFDSERSILDRGAHLGYDLSLPHQLLLIDVEDMGALGGGTDADDRQPTALKRDLIQIINRYVAEFHTQAIVVAKGASIVVLILSLDKEEDELLAAMRSLAEAIEREILRVLPYLTVSMAMTGKCTGLMNVGNYFRERPWDLPDSSPT